MQWTVIDAQLEKRHPIRRKRNTYVGESHTGSLECPPHVADSCPFSHGKMREEAHYVAYVGSADRPK